MPAPTRKPSYRSVVKILAANVHAKERVVLKCAVEFYQSVGPDVGNALEDAVADYTEAARLLAQATEPGAQ